MAFLLGVDVVGRFIRIGQGFVVVDLIAEVALGVGKIIAIPRLAAVQLAALGYGRILVFVDVVGVLAALGGKAAVLACAFELFVQKRILPGNIQLAVSVNGQHQPGGTLNQIVVAHVQVGKSQLSVCNLGGGYQPVFLQNGQVIGIPAAIGEDSGVPKGRAVGIGDFGVIYDTRNTVRVFNRVSGVQIVYRAFQRSIAVAARHQIPRGVQINFCQQDIAENAVVLHLVGIGVHGVGIFVVGNAGGVCGVGLICVAAAKSDSYHTLTGVDKGAAAVGRGNVGVIIGVPQPNGLTVQRFGNLKGIRPLAENRTCCAGFGYICPIAIVPAGCAALHNDKLALVALGVIDIIRTIGIIAVVDDLVSAVALAFNLVLVIPTIGDVALPDGIPLENLKLGIALDALLGFTVDFVDADFYRPLIVLHFIVIGTISRNSNSLVAAQRAGRGVEAVRDGDLIVCKGDVRKLRPRRSNSGIHHALRLVLQLPDGRILGSFCCGVCFGLAGERSFLSAERTGAGLGHLVVNRPCGRTIAAVEVKTVILCVTACGNGLCPGRGHLPVAAVHVAAGPAGRDGNDRAVHLFHRVQLVLVGIDSECQIKAAAGSLGGSLPVGIVLLRHGFGFRLRFFSLNGGTNQGDCLPTAGGGLINVGVISRFGGIGLHPVQQFLCRFSVKRSRPAVGVVLHNIQLQIVVNHFAKIRDRQFRLIFCAKNSGKIAVLVQRKLVQPAPNANLVAVMVTGDALVCAHRGGVGIAVRRAAVGLTVGTVGAAVGGFAVKPN